MVDMLPRRALRRNQLSIDSSGKGWRYVPPNLVEYEGDLLPVQPEPASAKDPFEPMKHMEPPPVREPPPRRREREPEPEPEPNGKRRRR